MIRNIPKEGKIKLSLTFAMLIFSLVVSIKVKNVYFFLGMLSSTVGDIAIMASRGALNGKKDKVFFIIGTIAFAHAHSSYVLAMLIINNTFSQMLMVIETLALGVSLTAYLKNNLMNFLYAGCILLAAIYSFTFHWLAVVGYVFFIISDIILVIKEDKEPKWQVSKWITYVIAQVLILTSALIVN